MPVGAVYVGRPTRWGNSYRVVYRADTRGWHVVDDSTGYGIGAWEDRVEAARYAVAAYEHYLITHPDVLAAVRAELAGRDLACWCAADMPCHANVLLRVANGGAP